MSLDREFFLDSLAKSLQSCRSFHNYSITDLAERSGIHCNSISAIENRNHDASSITCAMLCFALNVQQIELQKTGAIRLIPVPIQREQQKSTKIPQHAYIIERVGKAISHKREVCGLSQEKLAVSTGLHKNTIWSIERGLTVPINSNLFSIFYSLGVTLLKVDNFDIVLQ
ncbi:hypothetical protein MASR2M29_07620 [Spirochaetota bacterium]